MTRKRFIFDNLAAIRPMLSQMSNCLVCEDLPFRGVSCELHVKFRHPVGMILILHVFLFLFFSNTTDDLLTFLETLCSVRSLTRRSLLMLRKPSVLMISPNFSLRNLSSRFVVSAKRYRPATSINVKTV